MIKGNDTALQLYRGERRRDQCVERRARCTQNGGANRDLVMVSPYRPKALPSKMHPSAKIGDVANQVPDGRAEDPVGDARTAFFARRCVALFG